ncbi:hypothetical protein QBC43DRAFT_282912 [Cladorrhinum sp. PSN259]|nr:hypothetical protein QBC43DRAFT_282912 [Cladorrhinum sp. PSN259]
MADQQQPLATPGGSDAATSSQQQQQQQLNIKSTTWNTPKFREEYENSKNKLQHQDFSSSALPEPLTMRTTHSRLPGEDPATIQRMQAIVAEAKVKAEAEAAAPWP